MSEHRDEIIEATTAQILELARHGRMVLDKRGEPVLDKDGKPKYRPLSAADINAISKYLKETRPAKGDGSDVPAHFLNRLNRIADAKPIPALDTDSEDEATR